MLGLSSPGPFGRRGLTILGGLEGRWGGVAGSVCGLAVKATDVAPVRGEAVQSAACWAQLVEQLVPEERRPHGDTRPVELGDERGDAFRRRAAPPEHLHR